MPIEVKDIGWTETEQYVVLKIPLKGAPSRNVDIFSTDKYIKVSYPPYFYELALYADINDDSSKATIANGQVTFHLQKAVSGLWGQLHDGQHKNKSFMSNLRENALMYKQDKEQEKVKKMKEEKDKQKKFAVREQMRLDSEERKKMEDIKSEETATISLQMEEWKNKNSNVQTDQIETNNEHVEDKLKKEIVHQENPKKTENISSKHEYREKQKKMIPQPRAAGTIQVKFTPRVLPTPARESKQPEEEMWLQKVAEMNKMRNTNNKDSTDIEEMNPMWLKDKGNDFYENGNYVAAINAYTSALMLDSKVPMLFANRAACHLSLKQYSECVQDCSCALELYDPPVPANAMSRCRALTRRGTAYFQLEQYVNALRDYETAIKLDPRNEELKTDAYKIRRFIQGEESSD